MKSLTRAVFILALVVSSGSYSMRCSNTLILEGSHVSNMISLCGEPAWDNGSTVIYNNLADDGMDYKVHVNASGVIDNIEAGIN